MPLAEAEAYEKVIWSADVADVAAVEKKLDELPKLKIVKIDRLFVDSNGFDVFAMLRDRGIWAFDDAKIIEIPSKSQSLASVHIRKGNPWMLNCMAGIESTDRHEDPNPDKIEALKRFASECGQAGVRSCAVTVLTSKNKEVVKREFNGRSSIEQVLYYVDLLEQFGFTDIVCSPEEATAIRKESRFDRLDINTPGIRLADSVADDQARTDSPSGALRNGSTRLVIGRPITNDNALDAIVADILTLNSQEV